MEQQPGTWPEPGGHYHHWSLLLPPTPTTHNTAKTKFPPCSQSSAFKKETAPRASPPPNIVGVFTREDKGEGVGKVYLTSASKKVRGARGRRRRHSQQGG